ncbi:Protein of unknown function [Pyronema omphalodes CBS 100304]|uniref:Uncharacterized protein n=1 Tax=Pyronema omphalodes (strain CBS 100304) TaxID=1076935 RepID=U4LJE5_PYROM|nr:Protein of unknown function [Pyronema omphalodes CBS 100304]
MPPTITIPLRERRRINRMGRKGYVIPDATTHAENDRLLKLATHDLIKTLADNPSSLDIQTDLQSCVIYSDWIRVLHLLQPSIFGRIHTINVQSIVESTKRLLEIFEIRKVEYINIHSTATRDYNEELKKHLQSGSDWRDDFEYYARLNYNNYHHAQIAGKLYSGMLRHDEPTEKQLNEKRQEIEDSLKLPRDRVVEAVQTLKLNVFNRISALLTILDSDDTGMKELLEDIKQPSTIAKFYQVESVASSFSQNRHQIPIEMSIIHRLSTLKTMITLGGWRNVDATPRLYTSAVTVSLLLESPEQVLEILYHELQRCQTDDGSFIPYSTVTFLTMLTYNIDYGDTKLFYQNLALNLHEATSVMISLRGCAVLFSDLLETIRQFWPLAYTTTLFPDEIYQCMKKMKEEMDRPEYSGMKFWKNGSYTLPECWVMIRYSEFFNSISDIYIERFEQVYAMRFNGGGTEYLGLRNDIKMALKSIKTCGGENSLNYCRLWVLDLLLSYQAGFRWIPDWISQTTRSFSELLDGSRMRRH